VAVFEAWRVRQPGEIRRRSYSWDYDLALRDGVRGDPWKGFLVLHHAPDGTTDGYARYHVEDKWEQRQPRSTLVVDDMHALSDDAYVALWRYLAEVDWVARVKAGRRSPDERLPWLLTNARAASVDEIGDGLWARLLDVPRALEARTYAEQATVVLELADGEATGGRLRVELEAGVDGSACRVTTRSPDLSIDVSALAAAYLGGARLRDAVVATGVDEHRPGALAATERLFRTDLAPWCSTFF
jgi:predicted acetyltransferase